MSDADRNRQAEPAAPPSTPRGRAGRSLAAPAPASALPPFPPSLPPLHAPAQPAVRPTAPKRPESAPQQPAAPDTRPLSERLLDLAPPWLVSLVVHMVLMLVLALVTIAPLAGGSPILLEAVYAEKLGQQLLDATLESPGALTLDVPSPALALDLVPVDNPLAAPPPVPTEFFNGNQAVANLETPSIGLALTGREGGLKNALLAAYGGTAITEGAVRAGLDWLKRNQLRDGGWSLMRPYNDGALIESRVGATAMALLAFQGAGNTHVQGDYQREVSRGWEFLLKRQNGDGFFEPGETGHNHVLYAQAQATIALCEIYGMTKDEKFRRPAQLALNFAQKAQDPKLGGWRYRPQEDSDLSVTGWFVMAFQSGLMAGLEVPSPMLDKVAQFLDACATKEHGGSRYSYLPGRQPLPSMTAEGLLCRQYLGWKHDDPRLRQGVEFLLRNPVNYSQQNVYYWYYATQVCHHMDGPDWDRWNQAMREAVPAAQVKTGGERGSWPPFDDQWGPQGGRLFITCLSIYMLEVYYRHLPIYKWRLAGGR